MPTIVIQYCSHCNTRYNPPDGLFSSIASPLVYCAGCQHRLAVHYDEWEMMSPSSRDVTINLASETTFDPTTVWMFGGCSGVLAVVAVIGIAALLGFTGIFGDPRVMNTAYGVGIAVAIAVGAFFWWREQQQLTTWPIEMLELLKERIEQSRNRMKSATYRASLREAGFVLREIDDEREPPEVAESMRRIDERIAQLRRGEAGASA